MTWTNNLVLLLISNSISICFVWLLFKLVLIPLKALKLYTICYRLFCVTAAFWIIPFHYLYCSFRYYKMDTVWTGLPWHGDLFVNTLNLLCIIWALGVFVSTLYTILGLYEIKKLPLFQRKDLTSEASRIVRQIDTTQWLLDESGDIQLLPGLDDSTPVQIYQTYIPVPMTPLGLTNKILLPFYPYTQEELQMVVAHELSHIRRKDLRIRGIFIFIKILFWFHPLTWQIFKEFEYWSEIACDIDVCSAKNIYVHPKHYFYLLIDHAQRFSLTSQNCFYKRNCFMSGLGNEGKALKDRIEKVRNHKYPPFLFLITTLLCFIFFLSGTGVALSSTTLIEQSFSGMLNRKYVHNSRIFPLLQTDQLTQFSINRTEDSRQIAINQLISQTDISVPDSFYVYTILNDADNSRYVHFEGTAGNNRAGCITHRTLKKGTTVSIYIADMETRKYPVKIGWISPDNEISYFNCDEVQYASIEVLQSGNYAIFIENSSPSPVFISGRIIY